MAPTPGARYLPRAHARTHAPIGQCEPHIYRCTTSSQLVTRRPKAWAGARSHSRKPGAVRSSTHACYSLWPSRPPQLRRAGDANQRAPESPPLSQCWRRRYARHAQPGKG
eukprot:7086693-Alexandrium_andersonii.AAC.1